MCLKAADKEMNTFYKDAPCNSLHQSVQWILLHWLQRLYIALTHSNFINNSSPFHKNVSIYRFTHHTSMKENLYKCILWRWKDREYNTSLKIALFFISCLTLSVALIYTCTIDLVMNGILTQSRLNFRNMDYLSHVRWSNAVTMIKSRGARMALWFIWSRSTRPWSPRNIQKMINYCLYLKKK